MIRRWLPPIVAVCFLMAGDFKSAAPFDSSPVDLTLLFALLTAAVVGWVLLSTRSVPRAAISMLIGFAILLLPVLWAPATTYARSKVADVFTLTLLAAIAPAILVRDRKDAERWLLVWVSVCAVHAFGSFVSPVQDYKGGPISSFANNTITLGMTSSTVLAVTTLALIYRKLRWWIALPLMGASALALLNSGSRGPLIGVVMALMVAVILAPGRARFGTTVAGVGLIGAGLIYAYRFAPLYAQERIANVLSGRLDSSSSTRLALYQAAVRSIGAHPLGLGWGGFGTVTPYPELPYPHDIVLEVLVEAGVLIGAAFLAWLIVQLVRTWRDGRGFVGSTILALVVLNLFIALGSGDLHDNATLFFALGISAALYWKRPTSSDPPDDATTLTPGSPAPDDGARDPVVAGTHA
jgi:O-antigen ligase